MSRLLLTLALLTAACLGGRGTYARFLVAGERYEARPMRLLVVPVGNSGRHFFSLERAPGGDPPSARAPDASIQWWMTLGDIGELDGRTLDLSPAADTSGGGPAPTVRFGLNEEEEVHSNPGSQFQLVVSRIKGNTVEGSFEGRGLSWVSIMEEGEEPMVVAGVFRARLEVGEPGRPIP